MRLKELIFKPFVTVVNSKDYGFTVMVLRFFRNTTPFSYSIFSQTKSRATI